MRAAICLSMCMSWYALAMIPSANGDVHLWTFDEGEGVLADDVLGNRPAICTGRSGRLGGKGAA